MNTTSPDFAHVDDPELRDLLSGKNDDLGREELDFVVRSTLDAHAADQRNPDLDMLPARVVEARDRAVDTVLSCWGDGEDGDARAFRACRDFWAH